MTKTVKILFIALPVAAAIATTLIIVKRKRKQQGKPSITSSLVNKLIGKEKTVAEKVKETYMQGPDKITQKQASQIKQKSNHPPKSFKVFNYLSKASIATPKGTYVNGEQVFIDSENQAYTGVATLSISSRPGSDQVIIGPFKGIATVIITRII